MGLESRKFREYYLAIVIQQVSFIYDIVLRTVLQNKSDYILTFKSKGNLTETARFRLPRENPAVCLFLSRHCISIIDVTMCPRMYRPLESASPYEGNGRVDLMLG